MQPRSKISCTGTTSPTNQPRKDPFIGTLWVPSHLRFNRRQGPPLSCLSGFMYNYLFLLGLWLSFSEEVDLCVPSKKKRMKSLYLHKLGAKNTNWASSRRKKTTFLPPFLLFFNLITQETILFKFFSWISFPRAHEHPVRTVSNFFEHSQRYLRMKVYQRCQRHRRKKRKIWKNWSWKSRVILPLENISIITKYSISALAFGFWNRRYYRWI